MCNLDRRNTSSASPERPARQLAAIEREVHELLGRLAVLCLDDREQLTRAGFHLDAARDELKRLTAGG